MCVLFRMTTLDPVAVQKACVLVKTRLHEQLTRLEQLRKEVCVAEMLPHVVAFSEESRMLADDERLLHEAEARAQCGTRARALCSDDAPAWLRMVHAVLGPECLRTVTPDVLAYCVPDAKSGVQVLIAPSAEALGAARASMQASVPATHVTKLGVVAVAVASNTDDCKPECGPHDVVGTPQTLQLRLIQAVATHALSTHSPPVVEDYVSDVCTALCTNATHVSPTAWTPLLWTELTASLKPFEHVLSCQHLLRMMV